MANGTRATVRMCYFIALFCGPAKTQMFANSCSQMSGSHAYVGKVQITRTWKLVHDIGAESIRSFCLQLEVAIDLKCIVSYP